MARLEELLEELSTLVPTNSLQVRETERGKVVLLLGWYPIPVLHNIVQMLLDDMGQMH